MTNLPSYRQTYHWMNLRHHHLPQQSGNPPLQLYYDKSLEVVWYIVINGSKSYYRTISKLSLTNFKKKTELEEAIIISIKKLNILYHLHQFHQPSRQWWDRYPSLDTGPLLLVSMVSVVGHFGVFGRRIPSILSLAFNHIEKSVLNTLLCILLNIVQ